MIVVAIVSIGGGIRDTLVRSDLSFLGSYSNTFSILSTSMKNVWVSADHQVIGLSFPLYLSISILFNAFSSLS